MKVFVLSKEGKPLMPTEIFQAESLDRLVELEEDSDVRIARQMRDTQAKEVTHGAL